MLCHRFLRAFLKLIEIGADDASWRDAIASLQM
jgi:hypothetical protein